MHIENNRDHFINLCAYCQCCRIVVAVNVTVYVNVTRFPGQNLAVFCTFQINVACPICHVHLQDFSVRQIAGEIHCGLHLQPSQLIVLSLMHSKHTTFSPKCPENGISAKPNFFNEIKLYTFGWSFGIWQHNFLSSFVITDAFQNIRFFVHTIHIDQEILRLFNFFY